MDYNKIESLAKEAEFNSVEEFTSYNCPSECYLCNGLGRIKKKNSEDDD